MADEKNSNYFTELNSINVSEKTEKKNGLTYLSWAWAWGELKKRHPYAEYEVKRREDGRIYFDDGRYAWVETTIRIPAADCPNGTGYISHTEILPVMNNRNTSIPLEQITMMDINKAIQRALTKAVARHGLGLYIYAGEDLPEEEYISDAEYEASKVKPLGKARLIKNPKIYGEKAGSAGATIKLDDETLKELMSFETQEGLTAYCAQLTKGKPELRDEILKAYRVRVAQLREFSK